MNYKDVGTLLAIAVVSFLFGQQLQIWFIPSRETAYSCFKWAVTRKPAYICIDPDSPYFRCDITNEYCLNYMPFAEGTMGYVGR